MKTTPISLFFRTNGAFWLPELEPECELQGYAGAVWEVLLRRGAVFFDEIVAATGLLATQVEMGLGALVAAGRAASDSFAGLRALLVPSAKKSRRNRSRSGHLGLRPEAIAYAGRWSPCTVPAGQEDVGEGEAYWERVRFLARIYLRRYGMVFRGLLLREPAAPPWRDLLSVYRYWEAAGEIRGGHFVQGLSGEHFALPEAIGTLRSLRRKGNEGIPVVISACDPLNALGWLVSGPHVPRERGNRILLMDGEPVAILVRGKLTMVAERSGLTRSAAEALLLKNPWQRPTAALQAES